MATARRADRRKTVRFDYEKLSAGHAKRCEHRRRSPSWLVTAPPGSPTLRIVDPETRIENPAGKVGEIWVHGENVAMGYWHNPRKPCKPSVQARRSVTRHPRRDRG